MMIGGLQKFSLLDYPEHIAAIIFTQGCNFRCQFCYNPMLVWPLEQESETAEISAENNTQSQKGHSLISEDDLFEFLKSRQGKLDAVVISGGEPTLHRDLPEFIARIKQQGYKVKLDTNGSDPRRLAVLIEKKLLDYIAMDIKAPFAKYEAVVGARVDLNNIKESIRMIIGSGLPYEFRTTVVPELFRPADIKAIGLAIKGARCWYLQKFKADNRLVNPSFEKQKPYPDSEMAALRKQALKYVKVCELR